jgi:hypothetical protein
MYPYLNEMIKKRGIKKAAIAQALGCSYSSLCRKLSGKSPLLWKDTCIIQKQFFPDQSKERLFA